MGDKELYIGIDVGGTNVETALVQADGEILKRTKQKSPANAEPQDAVDTIAGTVEKVLKKADTDPSDVTAIGLGVPGVVKPKEGRVVVTPNMNLGGLDVVQPLEERLGIRTFLGNDVDLGTMGEAWLGAAKDAYSVVGMFIGTGIGGGIIVGGHVLQGVRNMAGEIGHLVMEMDGPPCGCGNRGCLEALASRSAMARAVRHAVDTGRETLLEELQDGDLDKKIKSKKWKKALKKDDELAWQVITHAFTVIGHACVSIRHMLDPEVIVLGGGVVEACEKYVMPIVQEVVDADAFQSEAPAGKVVASALGDDAGVLGGVAYAIDMLSLEHAPAKPYV
jgi:glucokinase